MLLGRPLSAPGVLAGSASAPGVPGGSAPTEAVAPLPGTVDEAQGILELLVGGFLDGLVGEVHLCGGTEGICEGCGRDPALPGSRGNPGVTPAPWDQGQERRFLGSTISCSLRCTELLVRRCPQAPDSSLCTMQGSLPQTVAPFTTRGPGRPGTW